jgi:hypothetical protein
MQLSRESDVGSGISSPLTSLSSLEDLDGPSSIIPIPPSNGADDLNAAQVRLDRASIIKTFLILNEKMLCSLRFNRTSATALPPLQSGNTTRNTSRRVIDRGMQTEPEQSRPVRTNALKFSKASATPKVWFNGTSTIFDSIVKIL